jgi:hypothetical protein
MANYIRYNLVKEPNIGLVMASYMSDQVIWDLLGFPRETCPSYPHYATVFDG